MQAANPNYRSVVEQGFAKAAFINDIGVRLLDCGPGWCESGLQIEPRHLQHTQVIHAGVQATMADHTAGGAAMTLMREGEIILTAEFKLNLLRAGQGESLRCRAQVLKPGQNLCVVESEIYAVKDGNQVLISKLTATMAVISRK